MKELIKAMLKMGWTFDGFDSQKFYFSRLTDDHNMEVKNFSAKELFDYITKGKKDGEDAN